jgi:choice-of-anchor B domain-containing protein
MGDSTRIRYRKMGIWLPLLVVALAVLFVAPSSAFAPKGQRLTRDMQRLLADRQPTQNLKPLSLTPCVNGHAGQYPCKNVDLLSFLPLSAIGGGSGSSIWGWTDPLTDKEYALFGRSSGTAFVDISDPINPVYVGNLPSHTGSSSWRELKSFDNYAFVVSDANGNHGMQIFDLTQLRSVINPPVKFSESARYGGFANAHDLSIDEETGFAFAMGTNTCSGGLHMVDVNNPLNPTFAGCFSADGYTHDAQCIVYHGPDVEHDGDEICFASNEDTLTIVDVTNKQSPVMLSRTSYPGVGYTHQGWLTANRKYFALDDELDEVRFGHDTWTRWFDVSNLEAPTLAGIYKQTTPAIDHNLFITRGLVFEGNYRAGLRIVKPPQTEVGFFDIYPQDDAPSFNAVWGNYPFFASGNVILSGIEQGLFVVDPKGPAAG